MIHNPSKTFNKTTNIFIRDNRMKIHENGVPGPGKYDFKIKWDKASRWGKNTEQFKYIDVLNF